MRSACRYTLLVCRRTAECQWQQHGTNAVWPATGGTGDLHLHDPADVCQSKKLPLEGLVITLKHSRQHPEDCEDCLAGKAIADHIQCDIQVTGTLFEDDKARLLETASRCPVHKTLHNPVTVTTRLVE